MNATNTSKSGSQLKIVTSSETVEVPSIKKVIKARATKKRTRKAPVQAAPVVPVVVAPKVRTRGPRMAKILGVVGQVRVALKPRNRLASFLGALLGGGVPVASFQLAHHEVDISQSLWTQLPAWLVLGGLLFSALTVFQWAKMAFGSGWKALGFAFLLEGVLTCASTPWLSIGALVYLCGINMVATGVRLSKGG